MFKSSWSKWNAFIIVNDEKMSKACYYLLKVSIRAKTLMQKLNNGSILFIFIKSSYKNTKLSVIQYDRKLDLFITTL